MKTTGNRSSSGRRENAAIVGVGAAACAACCAGPILGFLVALGIGTAAGLALFGLAGLMVTALIGAVLYGRRRTRRRACVPSAPAAIPVAPPTVRPST